MTWVDLFWKIFHFGSSSIDLSDLLPVFFFTMEILFFERATIRSKTLQKSTELVSMKCEIYKTKASSLNTPRKNLMFNLVNCFLMNSCLNFFCNRFRLNYMVSDSMLKCFFSVVVFTHFFQLGSPSPKLTMLFGFQSYHWEWLRMWMNQTRLILIHISYHQTKKIG